MKLICFRPPNLHKRRPFVPNSGDGWRYTGSSTSPARGGGPEDESPFIIRQAGTLMCAVCRQLNRIGHSIVQNYEGYSKIHCEIAISELCRCCLCSLCYYFGQQHIQNRDGDNSQFNYPAAVATFYALQRRRGPFDTIPLVPP